MPLAKIFEACRYLVSRSLPWRKLRRCVTSYFDGSLSWSPILRWKFPLIVSLRARLRWLTSLKIKSEEHFVSFFRWNYLCAAQKYRFNVHFPGSIQIRSCRRLAFTAGIGLLWLVFLLVLIPVSCFCLFTSVTFISNRHSDHGDPRLHFHFLSYVITFKMRLIFIGFTTWLWHYKIIKLIFWY